MHCRKFLDILRIELDDAIEDFDALIGLYRNKYDEGRLTDYVLQQNVGFVETEKQALRDVRSALSTVDICDEDELGVFRTAIEAQVEQIIREHDLPAPARDYILRKIDKVFRYVGAAEAGRV